MPRSSLPHHFADARPASAEWTESVWSCLYFILIYTWQGEQPHGQQNLGGEKKLQVINDKSLRSNRSSVPEWGEIFKTNCPNGPNVPWESHRICLHVSDLRSDRKIPPIQKSPMEATEGRSQISRRQNVLLWLLASSPPCKFMIINAKWYCSCWLSCWHGDQPPAQEMIAIPGQMHHVNLSQFFLFRCCPAHIAGMLRCPRSAPPRICHTAAESGELKICTLYHHTSTVSAEETPNFQILEAKGKGTKK